MPRRPRPGATGPVKRDVGILLTGVGKRYDIVSAFAQHATVVAVDPNPLAPAQYAADHRASVPRIDDPRYVPALAELCERFHVGAVIPLTDLDIEVLAHAREARSASGARARIRHGAGDLRQVRGAPAAGASRAPVAADCASG